MPPAFCSTTRRLYLEAKARKFSWAKWKNPALQFPGNPKLRELHQSHSVQLQAQGDRLIGSLPPWNICKSVIPQLQSAHCLTLPSGNAMFPSAGRTRATDPQSQAVPSKTELVSVLPSRQSHCPVAPASEWVGSLSETGWNISRAAKHRFLLLGTLPVHSRVQDTLTDLCTTVS